MKITASKVKKILIEKYNWDEKYLHEEYYPLELVKDTLRIVGDILLEQKGIKIK